MTKNETATELDYSIRKKELKKKSEQYQKELTSELEGFKENALHYGKYALVAGGVFVASYIVVGLLFPSDDEEEKPKEKIIYIAAPGDEAKIVSKNNEESLPPIAKAILTSIATFLISIAKEKLLAYLEQMNSNESQENIQPSV